MDFKQKISEIVMNFEEDLSMQDVLDLIEVPPNTEMGDFAIPCFRFAKKYRKSPNMIAQDFVAKLGDINEFEKIESTGPYLNFFVNKETLVSNVTNEIFEKKEKYGSNPIGLDKNVIVEFSSPNIAKPFHIAHIRSTVIGNALYNIYSFLDFNTIAINHLGDYGTQFGMLISAYKKWGNKEEINKNPISELLKLYVKFNDEAEKEPELREEAKYWFKELENGNKEAKELWQWIRDISLEEFGRVYKMLNIKFDSYAGESFYSDKMSRVVNELYDKDLLKESRGAEIVDLEEYNMPPAVIKKSDGSTLYMTRDIAAAIYRKETYDFYKNIYVVASQQNLHFKQWFKVVELMGYEWSKDCIHIPFGMVSLEDGTLSTRKGRVVFLEDVLRKAVDKTKEIIESRNPNLENKDKVAEDVGVGAVVFQELFNSRIKDYIFSWEKTLSFEGETGPYTQYTFARTCSVLRKADIDIDTNINMEVLTDKLSFNVIRKLSGFENAVLSAYEKNEPYFITRFIVQLAQEYNRFYHECPIITENVDVKKARLLLTYCVNNVLKIGLNLLGINAPEKM